MQSRLTGLFRLRAARIVRNTGSKHGAVRSPFGCPSAAAFVYLTAEDQLPVPSCAQGTNANITSLLR
ncbi:hypothetical protein WJX73_010247 [Symbiochloris irregularis]|uniref:Uncharacterized protein n=1 Tax=Symbiochloris irregularis TaxID=706552 RepID=A0AAW1NVM0_9CHLO